MEKYPVELAPGRLGCPDCRYPLVPGLTPFYYRGHNLGAFDGIVCEMCGFGLLTEKGYEDTGRAIAALDYVPPLHETDMDVEIKYVSSSPRAPTAMPPCPPKAEHRSTTGRLELLPQPLSLTKRVRISYRSA